MKNIVPDSFFIETDEKGNILKESSPDLIKTIFNENELADHILMLKTLPAGSVHGFEKNIIFDENSYWYNIQIAKLTEKFVIIISDISQKKIDEEKYRLIFENAVMGIYKSTLGTGRHIEVNPELARIYGYESPKDLLESITDISHQLYVNPERRLELIKSLKENGETIGFESQLYQKNGNLIWISENARAVTNSSGEIKFIVGTVKDITERKLAEEKMRIAKEDWEMTFDSIDNPVIILDKNLQIRRHNKATREQLKSYSENIVNDYCYNVFSCANENCKKCPALLSIKNKKQYTAELDNTDLGKTFLTSASPIFSDEKSFEGVVFVLKDITQEKKLKQEAEYRLQQVIQADKLKSLGEMVAGVAHEINNPNSYIYTNVLLLNDYLNDLSNLTENDCDTISDKTRYNSLMNEVRDITTSIKTGSQRIKEIVSNLKEFSRVNSPGLFQNVNINQIIDKSISLIGSHVKKSVKTLEINKGTDIPSVNAHIQKLEQVLINLVMNSIQSFNNKKESRITITSRFLPNINTVLLEVEDNGCGISQEVLPKLFEPFFTTRRESGGTGLGLSISYEIIKEHKGLISVLSKEGAGTKVSLLIPIDSTPSLSPKILCLDYDGKLSNLLKISFLEDTDKFFVFLSEPAMLPLYIENHPEVDIIILNTNYGVFSLEIIKKINLKFPLINIFIYQSEKSNTMELFRSMPTFNLLNDPFNIDELRIKLNSCPRILL